MKVCLHNHTFRSRFATNSVDDLRKAFEDGKIDKIAITDHDYFREAELIQKELGQDKVILGQEITTKDGDIIGIFLKKFVSPGVSAERTCQLIKSQGGLVYIPHPFDKKHGISQEKMDEIASYVDIVEVHNGWRYRNLARPFVNSNLNEQAEEWANKYNKAIFSSTDCHYSSNIGNCYTEIEDFSSANELMNSLKDIKSMKKSKNKVNLQSFRAYAKGLLRRDILKFIN